MKENKPYDILKIIIFLIPIIDALNTVLNMRLSLVVRSLFLVILFLYTLFFCKSKSKKNIMYILYVVILFVLLNLGYNLFLNGFTNAVREIISLIKFLYLPIITICLYIYYDNKEVNIFDFMIKLSYLYASLIILPTVFGIGLRSYDSYKLGFSGLFYSPNEISNILIIFSPFVLFGVLKNKKNICNYVFVLLFIISCFVLGTKTPFIGLVLVLGIAFVLSLVRLVLLKKNKKYNLNNIVIILILCLFTFVIYNNSYLKSNLNIQYDNYNESEKNNLNNNDTLENTDNIDSSNSSNKVEENNNNEKNLFVDNSSNIKFPTLKYIEKTNDNKILNMIFSSRNIYLQRNFNKIRNRIFPIKLMGITTANNSNTSELDMIDIYIYYGILGIVILLGYLLIIFIKVMFKIFVNITKFIKNDELLAVFTSFSLSMLIALTAGHTLGAPAVSTFIALDIVYLIKKLNIKFQLLFNKKIITTLLIFYTLTIIYCIFNLSNTKYDLNIKIIDGNLLSNKNLIKVEEKQNNYNNMNEKLNYYILSDYNNIELIYSKRIIDKNNEVYYFTLNNNEEININVNIDFEYKDAKSSKKRDYLLLSSEDNLIVSSTYKYKNTLNDREDNIYKKLIEKSYDMYLKKNVVHKNITLNSNTMADTYIIKTNGEIDEDNIKWMSYNGIYTMKEENEYYRDISNKNMVNNENSIFDDIYLFNLYNYGSYKNNVWYQDYLIDDEINYYLDATVNYNIYMSLSNNSIKNDLINNFSKMIKEEYNGKKYIIEDNGIIFNDFVFASLKNQVSITNILIENYKVKEEKIVFKIIEKLLNTVTSHKWHKDDKNLYDFVDEYSYYYGEIDDIEVLENYIYLYDNIKELKLSNDYSVDSKIKILINKFGVDNLNNEQKNILKAGGFIE